MESNDVHSLVGSPSMFLRSSWISDRAGNRIPGFIQFWFVNNIFSTFSIYFRGVILGISSPTVSLDCS